MSSRRILSALRVGVLSCFVILTSTAAPPAPERARPGPADPAAPMQARPRPAMAMHLPSSVLDPPTVENKIHVSSTDSKGNCPAGATKLDKCSGVYANGNSWEISPCCRTETN